MDGFPGENGWYPEERIILNDALSAYTRGGAYAMGMEKQLGMITPGMQADLIVLEQDPFAISPEMLHELQPSATMVDGEWVFQR